MSEPTHCPKCRTQLPADAPAGLCPKCLVNAGLESEPKPAVTSSNSTYSRIEPLALADLANKFPQLEILELLGKGGMGAVYKARQRGLDRLVAVKLLPLEIGHDPAFAERFTREAKALARLSHNHIVSVYDFGQSDGLFYIVMEYVDGVNLRQAIQTGTLTPQEALAIVAQICEALQFAHDEGIVHRDIKPENILIDKRGRVKIADYGLAKLMTSGGHEAPDASLTATHQVMGTLRYMAPEQMQGSREVDHRADIYSLGVIFYELLTGELPMGKFAPPSKRVQVDVRLDEIVLRALEQQPEQRYQHASDLKTDVEAIPKADSLDLAAERASLPTESSPIQANAASGVFSLISRAWDEWWADRAKWFTVSVQSLLFLVHLVCLIGFISMTSRGTWDERGRRQFTYELGVPSPWFRFETWPEPNTAFRHGIYPWTSSLLLAVGGLAVGYVICRIEKAKNPKAGFWHSPRAMFIIWLVFALVGVGVGTIMGFTVGSQRRPAAAESAAVPPLGTITSGIGASFTVPAGQVAVFEIVTRRDNTTVPLPPHCGYVLTSQDKPVEGTFRWSPSSEDVVTDGGRKRWRIEFQTAGGGGGHTDGLLLPEGLDSAVGARSLGLGLLEPNEEAVHWGGGVDANALPANGLIGLRVTVVPHGLKKTSGSGIGHTDWKSPLPPSTTRRKLPQAAP